MKKCDKQNNHLRNKLHTIYIYISSNNGRHLVHVTLLALRTLRPVLDIWKNCMHQIKHP
jgi:hypothetical protein